MKQTHKTQLLSCLLIAMLAQTISCGGTSSPAQTQDTTESTDTSSTVTTEKKSDDLPEDLNFGGTEFRMMTFDPPTLTWARAALDFSEQSGDLIDDAIYTRARKVEERLNVKIIQNVRPYGDRDLAKMREWILSGDAEFEIGMEFVGNSRTLALEGLLVDYDDLEYVDLTKEYWCQDLNKSTSIAGKHYLVYGDYSLSTHDNTSILLFNKNLLKDLKLSSPYELVESGKWTFDTFNSQMSAAVRDLNGDSQMDENDQYGYEAAYKEILPSLWISANETTISKDKDDIPYFSLEGDARFSDVFDKIMDMMWSNNHWFNCGEKTSPIDTMKLFSEDRALYTHTTLFSIEVLRNMDTDFGIVPYPKYDESQDNYYSRVGGGQFGCIPVTNTQTEMTGAVMEALCSESRKTVIPAYYEKALTGKYTRDDESAKMLDVIFANRIYDLGDTFWVAMIRDGTFRAMMNNNDRDLASAIASMKSKVEQSILETVEGFTKAK